MAGQRREETEMPSHGMKPFPQAHADILFGMTAIQKGAEDEVGVGDGMMG